jgi:dienelactone hydrolase
MAALLVFLASFAYANPDISGNITHETIRVELPSGSSNVDVYRPASKAKAAMVIVVHGFSRHRQNMSGWGEHLAKEGFVAVVPDLPAWSDHVRNGRFISELRTHLIEDKLWKTHIEPARIGLLGFSAGGLSSLLSVADAPDQVIWVGLDPVDQDDLGARAAAVLKSRALVLTSEPSVCNVMETRSVLFPRCLSRRISESAGPSISTLSGQAVGWPNSFAAPQRRKVVQSFAGVRLRL